jgi:hypothetical protein
MSLMQQAQAQVYNDAPYAWIGTLGLFFGDGSIVWNNQVVSGFSPDPLFGGEDTIPIFNTVTFVSSG